MKEQLRILYVADTRLPTEKAHGLALMKLSEAFAQAGALVEVVAPKLWTRSGKDPFQYYGVNNIFSITYLFSLDLLPLRFMRPLLYLIQVTTFSFHAFVHVQRLLKTNQQRTVIFSHDYIPLYFLSFLPTPFYYDIHHFPGSNFMYRRVMKMACGFSVQTKWKIEELQKKFGISPDKITYWPNGTDVELFASTISKEEARERLEIKIKGPVAMYTGQFFGWKGVETFIASIAHMPPEITYLCVGGTPEDTETLRQKTVEAHDKRVVFVPFQRRHTMPMWLRSADVLVLPNTGKQKVSRYYTSPMKLFEYMASGRPIVSSRLPSIEEIVDDTLVYFAEADNPQSFAEQITQALADGAESTRAVHARKEAQMYTWKKRAEVLLSHMDTCVTPNRIS